MKVSLRTISQLAGMELPPVDELVHRINTQLGAVEEIIDLKAKYKDALIVRVVTCEKHQNADKLSVCQIDAGTGELVQVVCGAPNVRADMWAVWLPPESTVPSTFDDDEPFVLGARELRGVMSNGMLASAKELGLGDDHNGIVEITSQDFETETDVVAGMSFAEAFGLDDVILDIENKMFTHRPDCFGQLGVAREVSAILKGLEHTEETEGDTRFVNPDWYWEPPVFSNVEGLELQVFNDAPEKSARFMAVAMSNVEVKPSPLWLQTTLVRWGSKSINNVVDATNYIMLLTAQPVHAYDYDKLRGKTLGARMANDNEKVRLLNDKTYTLTTEDVVIADAEGAIGLAGIMGGGDSEVSDDTTNIVLEVANFDMYTLRKSSMRHGLFTDALTRFNKGQSPLQNDRVLKHLADLLQTIAGATQASLVYDIPQNASSNNRDTLSHELPVTADFINTRLGTTLDVKRIGDLLRRANFASYPSESDEDVLLVTAPFWRTDIELPEDIVEEVGRLYGFEKLPRELPRRSVKPAKIAQGRFLNARIRTILHTAGANEVLTYSFVHANVLDRAGYDTAETFALTNALSPDLQYYRPSLLPSLLDKVHMNQKAGFGEFTLYEIGKSHTKNDLDADGLPVEHREISLVYAAKKPKHGAAFYQLRRQVEYLLTKLGVQARFETVTEDSVDSRLTPFEPSRTAKVVVGNTSVGYVGEPALSVSKSFKLPEYAAMAFLDLDTLVTLADDKSAYKPLSKYPSVTQDVSIRVSPEKTYAQLYDLLTQGILAEHHLTIAMTPIGIYRPKDLETQTYTFRFVVSHDEHTLTDADVQKLIADLVAPLERQLDAEIV